MYRITKTRHPAMLSWTDLILPRGLAINPPPRVEVEVAFTLGWARELYDRAMAEKDGETTDLASVVMEAVELAPVSARVVDTACPF